MSTRTLVVWCPDWPVAAAGFGAGDRVVVVHANLVVACSVAARADGVRRGLRRREAQGRSPSAVVIAHDPGRDARAFEPVVAAVEAFAPGVEVVRPGVCALATRGPSRYFGGDHALAQRLIEHIRATAGHDCRVGVAEGLFAATLAARRGMVVPPGETPAFLAPLPVAVLDDPELVDLFGRLGLRTLADVARLPAADVVARFGSVGMRAHRRARGLDDQPPSPRIPPPELAVSAELDPPVDRVDAAAFAAKTAADELGARLARLGLACTRVRIEAETEHGEHLCRVWRHDGALTPAALAERVRWQLDGWLSGTATDAAAPTAGLTLLRLMPEEVHPDRGRQLGFWGGPGREAGGKAGKAPSGGAPIKTSVIDDRAARALARVQGMLGPGAVTTAVLAGGRGPAERACPVPWGDAAPRERKGDAPWPGAVPSPAPATVHIAPLPAEVVDAGGVPVAVTGRGEATAVPARLSIAGGRWCDIEGWAGPWPADERWWEPGAHRRRARWQVATGDGAAHLLAVEGGHWFVEATYD